MSDKEYLGNSEWAQRIILRRQLAFSTTTSLGANAVYTSPTIDVINYKALSYRILADQAGSFFIQYSDDGIAWDNSAATATAATANTPFFGATNPFLRYARFVYTNGATIQTAFRFSSYLSPL